MTQNRKNLTAFLDDLYRRYNHRKFISHDPLRFACRYDKDADAEIVALLSALLAYGRVTHISNSLEKLFALIGPSPYDYTIKFNRSKSAKLKDFRHRFNTGDDLSDLFYALKTVLKTYPTMQDFFCESYRPEDVNVIPALTQFVHSLLNIHSQRSGLPPSTGLKYLLADPAKSSPCKRLHLFLRWVVRDDAVDLGLWRSVSKSHLIIPMDVHMSRITGSLGFHSHKTANIRTALQATAGFAKIVPEDPVKYDFVLCRAGITDSKSDLDKITNLTL